MAARAARAKNWTDGLTFRFAAVFIVFTVATIVAAAISTNLSLANYYRSECVSHISTVARELETEMLEEPETFASFQDWLLDHLDDLDIDPEFDECDSDRIAFSRAFSKAYPNKVFGVDVTFDELPEDLKLDFATYYFKRWFLRFEQACDIFEVPYAYYVMPTGEGTHVRYIFDIERIPDEKADHPRMLITDDVEEDFSKMPQLVATWETGKVQDEVDYFENEYGLTCSYYQPLYVKDRLMGLVCVDGDVRAINEDVAVSTINLVIALSVIVIFGVIVLVTYINREYVSKLTLLNERVEEYARDKDGHVAAEIEKNVEGNDEIATLSHQIASMICELENHIQSIVSISGELSSARDRASKLSDLARTDAMTGLGNKLAYGECMNDLDARAVTGNGGYAVIMIDLNFLKRINDTHGHDKGDFAIRRLAEYISQVFADDHAFRIGGDEFCVVLEGDAANSCEDKIRKLRDLINAEQSTNPWEHISAAIGSSRQKDLELARDVFKRADEDMYANKLAMKAARQA